MHLPMYPATRTLDPAAARGRAPKAMAVLGLLLALGVAGCSSGGGQNNVASLDDTTSAQAAVNSGQGQDTSERDALVKYAQCMRAHGVDMPDPPAGAQGGARQAIPASSPQQVQQLQTASKTCSGLLPNGGKPTKQDSERGAKFAQCMRAHGVNMADPTPGQSMSISMDDPKTKAALTACMPAGSVTSGG